MRRGSKIILGIIIGLILVLGLSFGLTFSKDRIPNVAPSKALVDEILKAQSKGGDVTVDEEKLNGLIKYIFEEKKIEKVDLKVKDIYVKINGNRLSPIALVNVRGYDLSFSANFDVENREDALAFKVSGLRVGKMPIPTNMVLDRIKDNLKDYYEDGKIVLKKKILPLNIKNMIFAGNEIVLRIEHWKIPILSEGQVKDSTDKAGNSSTQNTSEGNKTNNSVNKTSSSATKKKLEPDVENSLKKISSDLSRVYGQMKTSDEKAIISKIQYTLNKVVEDPSYPYQKSAASVKAKYSKLSDESKTRIKSALMSNLDLGDVMKLVSVFGM